MSAPPLKVYVKKGDGLGFDHLVNLTCPDQYLYIEKNNVFQVEDGVLYTYRKIVIIS